MFKIKKKIFFIFVAALLFLVSGVLISNKIQGDAIKAQQESEAYFDWLHDNCDCLARERYYCLQDNFEVEGDYCVGQKTGVVTTRVFGCSEYNCSGEIKLWNNQALNWEDKTNG